MRGLKIRFKWLLVVFAMASLANAAVVVVYHNVTQDTDALTTPANIGDVIEIVIGMDTSILGGTTGFSLEVECSENGTAEFLVGGPLIPPMVITLPPPSCAERFQWPDTGFPFPPAAVDYLRATFTVPACALTACSDGFIDVSYNGTFVGVTPADVRLPVAVELDFGDAPAPYPTLLANNGARHTIDANVYLGRQIDDEPDGQPTAQADGDDANNLADEDGVCFTTKIVPGQTADVNVTASCNGLLDAWVDFNIDGDWDDAGEQIFTSHQLDPGSNILAFNVPSGAVEGDSYARFRFSTAGGLDPNGLADDGEVEDYTVFIGCPCWGDINGDGKNSAADMTLLLTYIYYNCDGSSCCDDWWPPPIPEEYWCIDLSGDNCLGAEDFTMLLMHLYYNGGCSENGWTADFCYGAMTDRDFGDAPAPYPTLLANNGARHTIDANVYLGRQIDDEPDGRPTAQADGDDAHNLADEDGVCFIKKIVPDNTADVNVTASCNGLLDAWLDFNIDGDWDDAGEQIFTSRQLDPGSNILTFNVPSGAIEGDSYARFRFSTAGGLDPNGLADDGEVEDYTVFIGLCPCWGDISGDGKNSAADMTLLLMHLYYNCGPYPCCYGWPWDPPMPEGFECIDLNSDNCHDASDMTVLLMHLYYNGGTSENGWMADSCLWGPP